MVDLEKRLKEVNEALKVLYKHDIDLAVTDSTNKELSELQTHIEWILKWL